MAPAGNVWKRPELGGTTVVATPQPAGPSESTQQPAQTRTHGRQATHHAAYPHTHHQQRPAAPSVNGGSAPVHSASLKRRREEQTGQDAPPLNGQPLQQHPTKRAHVQGQQQQQQQGQDNDNTRLSHPHMPQPLHHVHPGQTGGRGPGHPGRPYAPRYPAHPGHPAAMKNRMNAAHIEAELKAKEAELEELKRKLQEKEEEQRKIKEAQAAKEAARLKEQQQQEDVQKRKASLAKGFKSLAATLGPAPGAAGNSSSGGSSQQDGSKLQAAIADEWEVARVLDSKNDYECLKLHAGVSQAQVRKTYRLMAMSLHPDKCKLEGAAAAFQRLKTAYDNLCKITT